MDTAYWIMEGVAIALICAFWIVQHREHKRDMRAARERHARMIASGQGQSMWTETVIRYYDDPTEENRKPRHTDLHKVRRT